NNQSFSNFIFEAISKPKRKIQIAKANQDLIIELAKWGNNLNQVARHLNSKKSGIDRVGLEMLSRIENHLEQIRAKYAC
ncbi:plasmid mobilization relaxosome protein MobC, partial [Campylobacter fetus]